LHPDTQHCRGQIIEAHSIQNSKSLDSISENGCVYRFCWDFKSLNNWIDNKTIMPTKTGKSRVSTFLGFCSYHDRELFREIDTKVIEPTQEQSILLSIRSMANELYTKSSVSGIPAIMKEIESGRNIIEQARIQEIATQFNTGTTWGLEDIGYHYTNLFRIYNTKDYSRLNRLVIKLKENPEVVCSACFFPEFDMEGNILQNLDADNLELTTFEILSNGDHGIVQLCWYDNFMSCKKLADSICDCDDIPNAILKLVFTVSENHAFNISWFDNLSVLKKKGLMKLMMSNVLDDAKSNADKPLFIDKKKYVNWDIDSFVKEY